MLARCTVSDASKNVFGHMLYFMDTCANMFYDSECNSLFFVRGLT